MSQFLERLRDSASYYDLDRRLGQPVAVLMVCEARGMARLLERVCDPYGVAVLATGGFASLTTKNDFARAVREELDDDKGVAVLTLGDLDPSGLAIMEDFEADVRAFCGVPSGLAFERVLLTEEQAEAWNLESAPPKPSDSRSKAWGEKPTYQLEAVPPDVLSRTVEEAVRANLDLSVLAETLERERREREELVEMLGTLDLEGWPT